MYTGQSGGAIWFSRTGRYRFSYLSFFFFFSSLFYISPSSSYSSFTSFFFSIRPSFLYSLRFPLAFLPFFVRLTFRGSLGVLCGYTGESVDLLLSYWNLTSARSYFVGRIIPPLICPVLGVDIRWCNSSLLDWNNQVNVKMKFSLLVRNGSTDCMNL